MASASAGVQYSGLIIMKPLKCTPYNKNKDTV